MSSTSTALFRRIPRSTAILQPRPLHVLNRPSILTLRLASSPFLSTAFFSTHGAAMSPADTQDQGTSTSGISEWKKRAPYKVHDKDSGFEVKYEANCHCGKVKYELGREKPLDSKLCHCTTCQVQHGMSYPYSLIDVLYFYLSIHSSIQITIFLISGPSL